MKTSPQNLRANGLWNIFTGKKKYHITCGNCDHSYSDKVVFSIGDTASSVCPCCNAQNLWSHSKWDEFYSAQLERDKA